MKRNGFQRGPPKTNYVRKAVLQGLGREISECLVSEMCGLDVETPKMFA